MLVAYIVSGVLVLTVDVLCFLRPNAGRMVLGLFFLAMGIGVNGMLTLIHSQGYVDYLSTAILPVYRELTLKTVAQNPTFYGLLVIAFETGMGLLILSKGIYVKIGLLGTTIFVVALMPVSTLQCFWFGLVVGQAYLLTNEFPTTFLDMLRSRKGG